MGRKLYRNPAIFPLMFNCDAPDVVMVHITPADRPGVPKTSPAIMNRMQEMSFNVSLIREMRTIAYMTKLIETDNCGCRARIHAFDRGGRFDQGFVLVEPVKRRLGFPDPSS